MENTKYQIGDRFLFEGTKEVEIMRIHRVEGTEHPIYWICEVDKPPVFGYFNWVTATTLKEKFTKAYKFVPGYMRRVATRDTDHPNVFWCNADPGASGIAWERVEVTPVDQ